MVLRTTAELFEELFRHLVWGIHLKDCIGPLECESTISPHLGGGNEISEEVNE
jgi:hypothetical protein